MDLESDNASIGNPSNESLVQSRGSQTIKKRSNDNLDGHSLESLMQSRGSETITESANASIGNPSNEPLLQSRGSETITESANASIGNPSNESLLQSRGSEHITESANASKPVVAGRESECIIYNWTFLKENITADCIKDELISTKLINKDDCDERGYNDKSRQCKMDHLLTCVVCNIGSTSDLDKFINIFETDHKFIADKLKLLIEEPDWSKGVKNVEKCRHRLATNRKLIEKELKKPQKLFDNFLENFVFNIQDHKELCNLRGGRKKMAECFMDKVLTSVEKGSYDLLLHILKKEMCNISHDYQTIVDALEKTPDQSVPEKSVSITLKSEKLYKSNEDNTPRTDVSEGCTFTITIEGDARCEDKIKENAMRMNTIMVREFGVVPTHVTDGSVVIHLKSVDGNIISRLTDGIRRRQFVRLIKELFSCHEANSSIPSGHWSVEFTIELDNSSSKMKLLATPLKFVVKTGDHRLQLLHANKAFLQEEIDPLTLLEAFSKRGFDHFKKANIEIIDERKLRTDTFLDILEKKSDELMDVFIKILEDQKMNFVLKRLKLYQKMQTIDAALLKENILKHIESIVDEVDLEDIKDDIISRYGLHKDILEESYSQFPEGSEGRIVAMIVDILGQGDSAVCMFIDILFNSGIDSSLLEELSDIEQVSNVMDYVGDNAFEVIRKVPKRGLIFQCEIEVTIEVKGMDITGCTPVTDEVDPCETNKTPQRRSEVQQSRIIATISKEKFDRKFYRVNSGRMLVMNNQQFNVPGIPLADRIGSDVDATAICKRFYDIGFEYDLKVDITKEATFTWFENAKTQMKANPVDCFVLVLMSHGIEDGIYATDSLIQIADIIEAFNATNCPQLRLKPKVLISQSGRGSKLSKSPYFGGNVRCDPNQPGSKHNNSKYREWLGTQTIRLPNEADQSGCKADYSEYRECLGIQTICLHSEADQSGIKAGDSEYREYLGIQTTCLHNEADFLFVYATLPGCASFRDAFIQHLSDAIGNMEVNEDFYSVLTTVIKTVGMTFCPSDDNGQINNIVQMPCFISNLTKILCLKQRA